MNHSIEAHGSSLTNCLAERESGAVKFQRSNIDDQFIDEVEKSVQMKMEDSVGQTLTQADLFKTPNMRLVTIVEMYQLFATTLGFYSFKINQA